MKQKARLGVVAAAIALALCLAVSLSLQGVASVGKSGTSTPSLARTLGSATSAGARV